MLAMQYSISLPATVDRAQILGRVEQRKDLFADCQGMRHKSYLYSEEDRVYAPFYIWQQCADAQRFLLDDLFRGVVTSFSRPRIRHWYVLHEYHAPGRPTPQCAMREADSISPEEALHPLVEREWAAQTALRVEEALCYHVIALDPDRWEIIRYSEWQGKRPALQPDADCVSHYEVLHRTLRLD
jgi:hypothetical protein